MFSWFQKIKKEIREFFQFARDHRIKKDPRHWYKGVLLLLIGWGFIAIGQELFHSPISDSTTVVYFFVTFSSGLVFIVVFGIIHQYFIHKSMNPYKYFRISQENEISGEAILSTKERRILLYIRGILAAVGYIAFQLAKSAIGGIDNAIIYSADSLMYAIIAWWLLKVCYNKRQKLGIFLVTLGVLFIAYHDLTGPNHIIAVLGATLGITSSLSLAIILILTSVIVQHDYPIRITFYQCLCGFAISLVLVIAFLLFQPNLISAFLNTQSIYAALIEGVLYASALICFFQSFYYVDPLIVAVSSYSLDLYSVILDSVFDIKALNIKNITSTMLIAFGAALLLSRP